MKTNANFGAVSLSERNLDINKILNVKGCSFIDGSRKNR